MKPRAVCVAPDVADTPLAAEVRRVLPHVPVTITDAPPDRVHPALPPWQVVQLTRFHGGLVTEVNEQECSLPGRTEAYLACGINCPGRCTYCFLRECASVSHPVIHANLDAMVTELEDRLRVDPELYLHLGHVLDPLAYPFLGPLLGAVVGAVREAPRATLEIRTKFTAVSLLPEAPPPNVVLAFSFLPQRLIALYEGGTTSLEARLRAAAAAARRGYRLGIRLDPLLLYPGWQRDYAELCAVLLARLPQEAVVDVVAGCLRGPAALIDRARAEDQDVLLRRGEFVGIGAGKRGYPRPLRIRALRLVAARLGGRFPVRFCSEDASVEAAVFGRKQV